jgi:nucleotide-binding universal stress UspA family protein
MATQKKLLVLADGSERTLRTVQYLTNFMPVDADTRIVLFHVFSGVPEEYRDLGNDPVCLPAFRELETRETQEKKNIRAYLEQAKNNLVTAGFPDASVEIKLHIQEKGVARDIIEESRKGYTAVMLRRRGMGTLKNVILGSVAVKLLQSLTFIPIILVGQAPPVKKILLAVDASPYSMKAVEFVAEMMGGHGYEVCVFHAIIGLGSVNFDFSETNGQRLCDSQKLDPCVTAIKTKVTRLFQNIKELLSAAGFEHGKISEKIVSGVHNRSDAIIREAEEGGYGAIVVGRRGLSKVEAFFMGRVGHEVVHEGKKFTVWVV